MAAGWLTTHVLDTARGRPASGLAVTLFRLDTAGEREWMADAVTNSDGRTDRPLIGKGEMAVGTYELVFLAGDWLRANGLAEEEPQFLDQVPIRFGIADADAHIHVPLLLSPFGYSTYRGS